MVYLSTFVPKKCGLATYTFHLREAVQLSKGDGPQDPVIPVCNEEELRDYREPWMWPLVKNKQENYMMMADAVSESAADAVSLQHEFGIFGGEAGCFVLEFLKRVRKPVITTFHTVFEHPPKPYASVQKQIAELSDHLLVMNRKAVVFLQQSFGIPAGKITFIPHGAPAPGQLNRKAARAALGWDDRKVLLTFGLLGRGKGIDFALRVIAETVHEVPDLLYVIAGATHPEVRRQEGEAYREELMAWIRSFRLERHVQMIDRYIPEDELISLISAADLYVSPYPGMQQITSGTLAYAAGLGRPILSTPYCYARDLLQGHEEMLLPYGDVTAWSRKIVQLFSDPGQLETWESIMKKIGNDMHWPHVGAQHLRLFAQAAEKQKTAVPDVR
jgi:glycosyltransferase involved in cell wall biosynthesis